MEKHEILAALFPAQRGIPTLPIIFVEFNRLMATPMVSNRRIADLIMKDQSMVVKILRLANSALYGKMQEMNDLSSAITYLGLETLKRLILQISLVRVFRFESQRIPEFDVAVFWEHSIATAYFADLLATELRCPPSENYYISGLLHDIGKLLIYQYYPARFERIILTEIEEGIPDTDAESAVLKVDHAEVGAHIAESWKFNRELALTIENHHRCAPSRMNTVTAVVSLANLFAKMAGLCFPWEERPTDIKNSKAWQYLSEKQPGMLDADRLALHLMESVESVRGTVATLMFKN